jgi:hypothetical protein
MVRVSSQCTARQSRTTGTMKTCSRDVVEPCWWVNRSAVDSAARLSGSSAMYLEPT